MSKVTPDNGAHWSTEQAIFTITREAHGALSARQITTFGASSASAILGPDLCMPGQQLPNVPTAVGPLWNQLLPHGPNVTFATDGNYQWKRGHLINGRWGGSGANWNNLTALTQIANANHATVEGYIDNFLTASLAYEQAAHRNTWYGVYYCVQCSVAPFSAALQTNNANLYSYAPAFIKISWRAVAITKPVNQTAQNAAAGMGGIGYAGVPAPLPFAVPAKPAVMVGLGGVAVPALPVAGNAAGGAVLGALPVGFPVAIPGNGFDGSIEIHQT